MSQKWNVGEKQNSDLAAKAERAIMVGLVKEMEREEQVTEYLDELEFLAQTAGASVIKRFMQKMQHPDPRTFIGSGKVKEIADYIETHEIDLVIFDDDLTGKQTNILEEAFKRKILDRSSLILDIFATRAKTAQARTQVELAQMQYLLPRLRGLWTHLERQRGGIGMRGPGEQEIETDRRIVRDIIAKLKKELEVIDRQNQTQRKTRGELIRVSLVGYTNVGKSTLMNVLSKSDVLEENKLFATLDTTTRKMVLGTTAFLLSDTVGFIRKLPHHLIESFKSTLDEVRESDLLLHVVDCSHSQFEEQLQVVRQTLLEMKVEHISVLYIFNKIDAYREKTFDVFLSQETKAELETEFREHWQHQLQDRVHFMSARTGEGLDTLRDRLLAEVQALYKIRYPYRTDFW